METNTTERATKEKPLPCTRKRVNPDSGRKTQCTYPGFACFVKHELHRTAQFLCLRCQRELREKGWTVWLQIEGPEPPTRKEATA